MPIADRRGVCVCIAAPLRHDARGALAAVTSGGYFGKWHEMTSMWLRFGVDYPP